MTKRVKSKLQKKISKIEYVQLQALVLAANSEQKFYEETLDYSKQVVDKLLAFNNLSVEE